MVLSRSRLRPAMGAALALLVTAGGIAGCGSTGGRASAVRVSAQTVALLNAAPARFAHPGVLVSKSDLDLARRKIKAGAQPWTSAYDQMRTSTYASPSWQPKPRADVDCGSGSNPDHGCKDERTDSLAAYTDALMWDLTGNTRYAKKAISIMDAWSGSIKEHTNSNAPLQTGWSGANWSRAGELVHSTYRGAWSNEKRFATMLRTVYLPVLFNGAPTKNGNWELIMSDALIGISVFLNDRTSFNKAVALWRNRLPEYIYLKSDGPLPKAPAGITGKAAIIKYWQGQRTFTDGLTQETCRDFGHTGWALEAATQVAQTAGLQGVNLFGEGQARLTKAMELQSRYQLGAPAPSWLCGGSPKLGLGPVFEVGYRAYSGRVALPETKKYLTSIRPAGPDYFFGWETLTNS